MRLECKLKGGTSEKIGASPWVSPIVVTEWEIGGIRGCADLYKPNKAIVTDCFSTIDLATAYCQVPLDEGSRDLPAFITHSGLFRFCRVPYGLASASSAFQKMMADDDDTDTVWSHSAHRDIHACEWLRTWRCFCTSIIVHNSSLLCMSHCEVWLTA